MFMHGSKSKAWHGVQHTRLPVLLTCLVLIVLFIVMLFGNRSSSPLGYTSKSVKFHPTIEYRNGTDVISQIPESPKAVLFIAHGCNCKAVNFWDRSPSCPNCIGLPEDRLLVLHALAKKFAVLTVSSFGSCWTFGQEMLIVKDIMKWWLKKNNLENIPLVALGASSGGYFVSSLATILRFRSITLMIAEGVFDKIDITEYYPPTLFVHMPKDIRRQQKISKAIEILKNKRIDVAEVECMEFPLSPSFLADRIPGLDKSVSAKLFALFQNKGFVDKNGYMKKDGRATPWKAALSESKGLVLDKFLIHHVQEELNHAFALHEMTSLQDEQIFKWFESHMA